MGGEGGVEDWQHKRDGAEEGEGESMDLGGGHGEVIGGWRRAKDTSLSQILLFSGAGMTGKR